MGNLFLTGIKKIEMGQQFSGQMTDAAIDADGCMMGSHLSDPSQITKFPFFPSGTKSLLSKVLTRDVWDACKDRKDKYGYTFQQCIFSGCNGPTPESVCTLAAMRVSTPSLLSSTRSS